MVGRRLKPDHIVLTFQVGKVSWLDHIVFVVVVVVVVVVAAAAAV